MGNYTDMGKVSSNGIFQNGTMNIEMNRAK